MTDDLRERIEVIKVRAAAKYQNVPMFTDAPDEPCPGCGCEVFAAAHRDIDALIAEVERLERENEELSKAALLKEAREINDTLPDPEPEVDALKRWLS